MNGWFALGFEALFLFEKMISGVGVKYAGKTRHEIVIEVERADELTLGLANDTKLDIGPLHNFIYGSSIVVQVICTYCKFRIWKVFSEPAVLFQIEWPIVDGHAATIFTQ